MSILVNFGGSDDLHPNAPFYCSSCKKPRLGSCQQGGEEKHMQDPCSLDSLSEECIFEILSRLPGARERSNSACVSKRWLTLLSSISASKSDEEGSLTRCLDGPEVTDVRLAAMAVGTGGLGKLVIMGSHPTRGLTNVGLSAIAKCCPSLKVLSMSKVPFVGDDGLAELATGCPMLERLHLSDCPLVSTKGLVAIARSCPKLNCVSIKDCPLVGDQAIAGLMSSSSLTALNLVKLRAGDLALACIGLYGKAVTELCLAGLPNTTERGFWHLGRVMKMQKLKYIDITCCAGVTDLGLAAVAKGCRNLNFLYLGGCLGITDAGLVSMMESLDSGLVKVSLRGCVGLTDTAVLAIVARHGGTLRVVDLGGCSKLTDRVLLRISQGCDRLEELDVSRAHVTDYGVALLASARKLKLRVLSLSGCSKVTPLSVPLLVNMGESLVRLNLQLCDLSDARGINAIKEKMWWCDIIA